MIYRKISTYNEGECSNLCSFCLYDEIPACNYWSFIEGFGYDDKGNTIVVACSKFRKSTLGSRFVFNRKQQLLRLPKVLEVD